MLCAMGRCGQAALCPCRPRCTTLTMPNGRPPAIAHDARPSALRRTPIASLRSRAELRAPRAAMHPHAQRTPGSKPKQQSSCRCTRPPSRVAARPRQPAHCAHSFSRGLRGSKATAPTPRPHSALPIAAQPEHGVFRRVTTLKLKVCCLSIRDVQHCRALHRHGHHTTPLAQHTAPLHRTALHCP